MIVAVSENFLFSLEIFYFIQGETIETWVGAALCLSTMAGNEKRKLLINILISF
jgi:hypothetical protein